MVKASEADWFYVHILAEEILEDCYKSLRGGARKNKKFAVQKQLIRAYEKGEFSGSWRRDDKGRWQTSNPDEIRLWARTQHTGYSRGPSISKGILPAISGAGSGHSNGDITPENVSMLNQEIMSLRAELHDCKRQLERKKTQRESGRRYGREGGRGHSK